MVARYALKLSVSVKSNLAVTAAVVWAFVFEDLEPEGKYGTNWVCVSLLNGNRLCLCVCCRSPPAEDATVVSLVPATSADVVASLLLLRQLY